MSHKSKLIKIFQELYQIHSTLENHYEAKSYKTIVDILKSHSGDIKSSKDLENIPGIGKRTLLKVDEIINTGDLKLLKEMKKDKNIVARLELQKVLGIGPKLAKKLVLKNNITSIKDLKKSAKSGKINLTHMQTIGLEYYKFLKEPIPRKEITKYKQKLEKTIHSHYPNMKVIVAGSYRRGKDYSNDIDIIITSPKLKTRYEVDKSYIFDDIIHLLKKEGIIREIISRSSTSMMGITDTKRHIDIKIAPYNLLPFYLLYFGSGEAYSRQIRQKAKEKGYKLSEYGLYNIKKGKMTMNSATTEEEIYKKLGIPYIEPKNR